MLNPAAPRYSAETMRAVVEGAFRSPDRDLRIFELPSVDDPRDAVRHEVERALAEGYARIVAVGGDGTVSMVAEGLARQGKRHPSASLGIVPAGTTNVLARELGLPVSLEEAASTAATSGQALDIDAMRVADRCVLTQVGIGPDALMIRDTSRESQAKLGRLAYVRSFVRRAFTQRAHRFEIEFDGASVEVRAWQIIVANVGSAGLPPFTWGPRIDPTDGTLDLCVYDVRNAWDYARLAWRVVAGRHRRDEKTRFFRVRKSVTIKSARPLTVQGDGEIIGKTPVTLRVAPRALRVLVARAVAEETVPVPAEARAAAAPEPWAAASTARVGPVESVAHDVERMLATQSRTWVLQGLLRHPVAAIEALDAALFIRANRVFLGGIADRALALVSRVMLHGEGWALVILAMILADLWSGLRTAAEAIPVLGATMLTVNYPLKRIFRRRRPFIAFVKARVIGPRPRDFSFPSGHSAAGFAGAVILAAHAPEWSPLFYSIAVLTGLSRVYLGVHYPSDVAFGALLGSTLAAAYRAGYHALLAGLTNGGEIVNG